jgi:hypothetical protein
LYLLPRGKGKEGVDGVRALEAKRAANERLWQKGNLRILLLKSFNQVATLAHSKPLFEIKTFAPERADINQSICMPPGRASITKFDLLHFKRLIKALLSIETTILCVEYERNR